MSGAYNLTKSVLTYGVRVKHYETWVYVKTWSYFYSNYGNSILHALTKVYFIDQFHIWLNLCKTDLVFVLLLSIIFLG